MDQYPILALIVRFGQPAAILVAIMGALLGFMMLQSLPGWLAIVVALVGGGLLFVLAKSYVELIALVTEMLVPR